MLIFNIINCSKAQNETTESESTLGKSCRSDSDMDDCQQCQLCVDDLCVWGNVFVCSTGSTCPSGGVCESCNCPSCEDNYPFCFRGTSCGDSKKCVLNSEKQICECRDKCGDTAPSCNGACESRQEVCTPHEEHDLRTGESVITCNCSEEVSCENSSLPYCGGVCDNTEEGFKVCASYKDPVTGELSKCQCFKTCSINSECAEGEICENRLCIPQPPNIACEAGRAPQCNGKCSPALSCFYNPHSNSCDCLTPCNQTAPQCNGACNNEKETCLSCEGVCQCIGVEYDDRGNFILPSGCNLPPSDPFELPLSTGSASTDTSKDQNWLMKLFKY